MSASAPASVLPVEAVLRNGRRITLREVRPDDAPRFLAAFARLSEHSRYNRFLGAVREPPPSAIDRAVRPVAGSEVALVATCAQGGNEEILGGARYFVENDGFTCEFAITVVDDCRRMGLASHMMQALVAAARLHGMKRMYGYVLAGNRPMLGLARRLGFAVMPSDAGPTVRLVSKDLC